MHLVGFIIRIYHDARSSECQKPKKHIYKYGKSHITYYTRLYILYMFHFGALKNVLYLCDKPTKAHI